MKTTSANSLNNNIDEVVVIGGMNMDIQGRSYSKFINNDSNPGAVFYSAGGVGRNIAENLVYLFSKQNFNINLITVLGDDVLAQELIKDCAQKNINLSPSLKLSKTTSAQYLCLLDNEGKHSGAIAAMDSFDKLTPTHLKKQTPLLDNSKLIIIDTNISEQCITWLTQRYSSINKNRKNPIIGLDTVSKTKALRAQNNLQGINFVKTNYEEALVLADVKNKSSLSLPELCQKIHNKGVVNCFISLGAKGLYYSNGLDKGQVFLSQELLNEFKIVNVSGAGDSVCASIAWGLINNLPIKEIAAFAVVVATITCSCAQTVNSQIKNLTHKKFRNNYLGKINYE